MIRTLFAVALGFAALAAIAAPIPKESQEPGPPTEKQLEDSRDNLKRIGRAFRGYHDLNGVTPNNTADKDGKALLSWRVLILRGLDEEKLYDEFKFDEPWDSKANKALIAKIPKVYQPVRVKAEKGETFYRGFTGADTPFERGKRSKIPQSFPDGTSNIILAVEAGVSCVWTKPDDLPFDDEKPLPKLGGLFDGDFHALLVDGSVFSGKSARVDPVHFKHMITVADGFVVDRGAALGTGKK